MELALKEKHVLYDDVDGEQEEASGDMLGS